MELRLFMVFLTLTTSLFALSAVRLTITGKTVWLNLAACTLASLSLLGFVGSVIKLIGAI